MGKDLMADFPQSFKQSFQNWHGMGFEGADSPEEYGIR